MAGKWSEAKQWQARRRNRRNRPRPRMFAVSRSLRIPFWQLCSQMLEPRNTVSMRWHPLLPALTCGRRRRSKTRAGRGGSNLLLFLQLLLL